MNRIVRMKTLVVAVLAGIFCSLSMTTYAGEAEDAAAAERQYQVNHLFPKGRIDAIEKEVLIIDDLSYPLSQELKIFDLNGAQTKISSLVVGRYVALKKDEGKLLEIHLIAGSGEPLPESERKGQAASSVAKPSTNVQNTKPRLENGVWKN